MRSCAGDFDLVTALDLNDALQYLSRGFQPMAGGTDLMVLFNAGKLLPRPLVSVQKLAELKVIDVRADAIEIGAAATYTELREHRVIRSEFPLLAQSAGWTGGKANQNRGTLGGNIANASPAADSSPVLLVYGAELRIISSAGERFIPYGQFHLGYKSLDLRPGELIGSILLPRGEVPVVQYGRKVGPRRAMAISKISLAATASCERCRIAAGSVAPMPLRCSKTEQLLQGQKITDAVISRAKTVFRQEISPISDIRSTRDYRLMAAENLLGEFLEMLL